MVESGQFGGLRIWNKKLKKWLLWGTGMIWRKFSICSRKNNPIQPCKIHLFFPYIFGGQILLTGSLLIESPLPCQEYQSTRRVESNSSVLLCKGVQSTFRNGFPLLILLDIEICLTSYSSEGASGFSSWGAIEDAWGWGGSEASMGGVEVRLASTDWLWLKLEATSTTGFGAWKVIFFMNPLYNRCLKWQCTFSSMKSFNMK